MEKNKINCFFILLLFFNSLIACKNYFNDKNYLIIKNTSNGIITNVKIENSNGSNYIIGNLGISAEYKHKLLESENENSINLVYTDQNNKVHKILVIPYLILAENKTYNYAIK